MALENIVSVRQSLYASELSSEEFSDVLKQKKGITKLAYLPDFEQDKWQRVSSIIEVDRQFNQQMHENYQFLAADMSDSYKTWKKDAYPVAFERRKAKEVPRLPSHTFGL